MSRNFNLSFISCFKNAINLIFLVYLNFHSACTDSDTGCLEHGSGVNRKSRKSRRKRTTNLGPRLKVLKVTQGDDAGIKVECQMDTAKQKTITFEFSTLR